MSSASACVFSVLKKMQAGEVYPHSVWGFRLKLKKKRSGKAHVVCNFLKAAHPVETTYRLSCKCAAV